MSIAGVALLLALGLRGAVAAPDAPGRAGRCLPGREDAHLAEVLAASPVPAQAPSFPACGVRDPAAEAAVRAVLDRSPGRARDEAYAALDLADAQVLALAGRPGPEGTVGQQELGRLHTPESTACLLDALTRGDAVHRAKAAGSLGRSRDRAQQRRLLEVAARDPDAEVRARAAAGAGLLAEAPTAPEDVAGLIATLRSATSQTARVDAIDALVASGDRRALSPLVDAAWDDDPAVARRAARALSLDLSADLRLTARVLERTRRPGWGSRADVLLAAELVSSTRALDAVPLLAQWLGDRDPAVRVVAVRGLDAVGPPDLEAHLLRALSDPEPAVRGAASVSLRSGALRTCDEPVRVFTDAPILALLADPSPYLRAETAHDVASRGIDPPTNGWSRVEVALVGLLRERDPFVVLSAADALVTLGVRDAAPAMRKAARAAPRGVRREVRAYLERTAAALEAAPDPAASPR